ncbi:MAG: hypothetical protein ABJA78_05230 [Ferruginibacter sp.]
MTEEQVDFLLQDAVDMAFDGYGNIHLIFPNEHEAASAFRMVNDFFKQEQVFLNLVINANGLTLIIHDTERFVKTTSVNFDKNNLEDQFVKRSPNLRIKLFMLSVIYPGVNKSFLNMEPIIAQQNEQLNIAECKIIPFTP